MNGPCLAVKPCVRCGGADRRKNGRCRSCAKKACGKWRFTYKGNRRSSPKYNKPCAKCGDVNKYSNGNCKSCSKKAGIAWRIAHPDYNNNWARSNLSHKRKMFYYHVLQTFGLTTVEFDKLLLSSCGKCDFCGKPFNNERGDPAVDHDHKTGAIRGMVHNTCNSGLGLLGDSLQVILERVSDYMTQQKKERKP